MFKRVAHDLLYSQNKTKMGGFLSTTIIGDIFCEIVIFEEVNEILNTKEKDLER